MNVAGGQICARSRFWVSLRVDGELSELEGALLDAHLARCADCASFATGTELATGSLRAAPREGHPQFQLQRPAHHPRRRFLLGIVAAAIVVGGAVLGGELNGASSPATRQASHAVVGVASVETADQLRRLRRDALVATRRLPRDLSAEPT